MKKTKKATLLDQSVKDYSVDDMLDLVQYRLDSTISPDRNTSSSSSENASDLDMNIKNAENLPYPGSIKVPPVSFDHNTINLTNLNKEPSKSLKRKGYKMTDENERKKKVKVNNMISYEDSDNSTNSKNSIKSNSNYSHIGQEAKLTLKDHYIGDCQVLKNGLALNPNTLLEKSIDMVVTDKKIKRPRENSYLQLDMELKKLKLP